MSDFVPEDITNGNPDSGISSNSSRPSVPPNSSLENSVTSEVKMSLFLEDRPDLWFQQVDLQSYLSAIKSDRKKHAYVFTSLPGNIVKQVSDILAKPFGENSSYEDLKRQLLARLMPSNDKRISEADRMSFNPAVPPSTFFRELISTFSIIF